MKLKPLISYLLNENIAEEFDEAAKTVADASTDKLALMAFKKTASGNDVVLYNPKTIKELFINNPNLLVNGKLNYDLLNELLEDHNAIVGYIKYKFNQYCDNDAYEVKLSAAYQGYGPLMYDIALSYIYPKYLISDRTSVSDEAQSVWKYYLNKRPDVNKVLISSILNKNPNSYDVCRLPPQVWEKIGKANKKLQKIKVDMTKTTNKERLQELQQELEQTTIEAKKELEKTPTAYKYQINKPLNIAKLKTAHTKLIKSLINPLSNDQSLNPKRILDIQDAVAREIEFELFEAARKFFSELYNA